MRRLHSIDELETFVVIADTGSLSGAARRLGVTPNAVSRRLQELEASAEAQLIQRTTRRMSLTSDGLDLLGRARRVLEELGKAEEALARRQGVIEGEVRFGLHPEMSYLGWYERLSALMHRHPGLQCAIHVCRTGDDPILPELDFLLGSTTEVQGEVRRRLGWVRLGLCAAPSYAARRGLPGSLEELAEHECLLSLREGQERRWPLVDEAGQLRLVPVRGRLASDDAQVLRASLYAGLGIGARPLSELRPAALEGRLIHLFPAVTFGPVEVVVVGARKRLRLRRVRAVLGLLEEELRGSGWLS